MRHAEGGVAHGGPRPDPGFGPGGGGDSLASPPPGWSLGGAQAPHASTLRQRHGVSSEGQGLGQGQGQGQGMGQGQGGYRQPAPGTQGFPLEGGVDPGPYPHYPHPGASVHPPALRKLERRRQLHAGLGGAGAPSMSMFPVDLGASILGQSTTASTSRLSAQSLAVPLGSSRFIRPEVRVCMCVCVRACACVECMEFFGGG
jgi:hypothetical protein